MQTVEIALPRKGVDKLSNETSLKKQTWRTAVNVDIDHSGQVGVRQGYTKLLNGTDYHSTWYALQRGWLLTGKGNKLMLVDPQAGTETQLAAFHDVTPLSYTEYNGNLYILRGTGLSWVPMGSGTVRDCGRFAPTAPVATPSGNGGLTSGTYGVVITVIDDLGEESPATPLQTVALPNGGGIQLSGLPIVSGGHIGIYITTANGDFLYSYATPPATLSTHLISALPQGGPCTTQFLTPFPGGSTIRWHNGRLYTAVGDTLLYSDPFRPHLTRFDTNFVQFSGSISFVEPVAGGIYVGDERGVWFLDGGDPTKFTQRRVSACRAVPGTSIIAPNEHFDEKVVNTDLPVAVWLCTSGYAVGTADGTVVELNADIIRVPLANKGSSSFAIRSGRKQVLTLLSTATQAAGMATDTVIDNNSVERDEFGMPELREDGAYEARE